MRHFSVAVFALKTKLEHRGVGAILTFAFTWAKSTDSKSALPGIGGSGFNGWQGFLDNHDRDATTARQTSMSTTDSSAASSTTFPSAAVRSSLATLPA